MKVEEFSYKLEIYKNKQLIKTFNCPSTLIIQYANCLIYDFSPFSIRVAINSDTYITLPQ